MKRTLLFTALLLAGPAQAYVILESKYRVEVSPGVFEDQLILKCDNGRKITVPWEARLSEACGEVDVPKVAAAAQSTDESQERQKEILMSRMREQYGDIDERHVTVESGLGGAEAHFSPQMREILKRYELCRKNTKGSPSCAAERNQAMAALSSQPAAAEPLPEPAAAAEPQPAAKAKSKPAAKPKQTAAKPVAKADLMPPEQADTDPAPLQPEPEEMHAATQPATPAAKPAADPPVPAADRTAREQKIAQDYAWCMRAKPKFECETERAAALKALDAPAKPKARSKSAKAPKSPEVAAN
jgi:hypothetical protein